MPEIPAESRLGLPAVSPSGAQGTKSSAPQLADGQVVTSVIHWTDRLFSFRVTRPPSLRFRSGEFLMIGLPGPNDKPIMRAYSIASPAWDEQLEFFSIKVPDGPLTSMLQRIEKGDQIILRPKPTGTLVLDALIPGKRLYMFATGTGIAPFASLIRDPETYEKFDQVILTHTCREIAELSYGNALVADLNNDLLVGEEAGKKLRFYTTVTQQDFNRNGRVTDRITDGRLFEDLDVPPFDSVTDRAMICGSMGLNNDLKVLVTTQPTPKVAFLGSIGTRYREFSCIEGVDMRQVIYDSFTRPEPIDACRERCLDPRAVDAGTGAGGSERGLCQARHGT